MVGGGEEFPTSQKFAYPPHLEKSPPPVDFPLHQIFIPSPLPKVNPPNK